MIMNDFILKEADFYMHEIPEQGIFVPRHAPSGLAFLHDFGGSASTSDGAFANFKASAEESFAKFSWLGARTASFLNSNLDATFVYYGPLTQENAERLLGSIGSDKARRILLNVVPVSECASASDCGESFVVSSVDDEVSGKPAEYQWSGNDSAWESVFSSLSLPPAFHSLNSK